MDPKVLMLKENLDHFHSIIIGAGPAGLAAAKHLTGSVLVMDRKSVIGDNVRCGDVISVQALQREGLPVSDRYVRNQVQRILRHFPNGVTRGEFHEEPYGVVLDRAAFEIQLGAESSAEFCLGILIKTISVLPTGCFRVETSDGNFECEYLIGADGPKSLVRKCVFGERQPVIAATSFSAQFTRETDARTLHLWLNNEIVPGGYALLFPTGMRSANIGLLSRTTKVTRRDVEQFTDELNETFGSFTFGVSRSGLIPVGGFHKKPANKNCLLVGDAGGYCDPIFDGGLNMALLTGRLAAECINARQADRFADLLDNLLPPYPELIRARDWLFSRTNEELCALTSHNESVNSNLPSRQVPATRIS